MTSGKYILRGKEVVQCTDLMQWGKWLETADRRVAIDYVGDIRISTVFLGIDHNYADDGPPILFETMVFGADLNDECERYSTWDEAEAGHRTMVEKVKASEHWPEVTGS